MYHLYVVQNLITSQKYYGITSLSANERWKKHLYAYKTEKKKNDCPKFYNSIRKYGEENFKVFLLESSENPDYIEKLEIEKISNDKNCLNISPGGGGMTNNPGWKHSDDTIKKLKEKTPPMLGKKHTEETKRKISEIQKGTRTGEKNGMYGKKHSEEWKIERRNALAKNHPMRGKTHTEETKEKIRKKSLGRKSWNGGKTGIYSEETLKKMQISRLKYKYTIKNPNEEIFITYNMSEFCKKNNLSNGSMGRVSLGYQNHHKGWTVVAVEKLSKGERQDLILCYSD